MERQIKKQSVSKSTTTKITSKPQIKKKERGGFKKQYFKSRPGCKVTFRLPKEAALEAQDVTIVGDFNNWDKDSNAMKRLKNGYFTVTLELEKGREYRFRYLIDKNRWENDWHADRYMVNPYGCDDSVVIV